MYVDIFHFEPNYPTLEAYEEFILSIILVLVVLVVIVISYYNLALAIRGRAPFKVCTFLPQILFPRGKLGLGTQNLQDDSQQPLNRGGARINNELQDLANRR